MGRGAVALGAVLLIAGGGVLGYALTREAQGGMSPAAADAMTKATADLDAAIKAARGEVRVRATRLSGTLAVRAAVITDEASAKDAFRTGELQFSPGSGEVIELGQVRAGTATPFLIQPEGAMSPSRNGVPGSYATLIDDKLVITEVNEVLAASEEDAIKDGQKVTGYVMVSRPLELGPAIASLETAGVNGRFEVTGTDGTQMRDIGKPLSANAKTRVQPLPSEPGAQLVVAIPPAVRVVPVGIVGAGGGAAVLGLVLVVVGLMRGKPDASAPPATQPTHATDPTHPGEPITNIPYATTKLSTGPIADGTPSPIDPGGSSSINPANLGPGAMIGRWEIVRRLGSGGMADVYLAKSRGEAGFEKLVAIKVMHGHLARNQRAVDHFLDEARLAARIHHPNVVAIQDLGKIGNEYVIVMDYVEGVDLERLLMSARVAGRPVPLDVGLGILCRICDGLNAAHRATATDGTPLGVIHRDVKSANVLVSRQGGVMVVDFGIAKAATQVHLTVAGETKGTPSMMAPEQRVGEAVDVRADVYSTAAVCYEVLTGQAVNLDLAALAHLGIENWPHLPPPSSLRADLPPELDKILLTAMAYDRERRPADCMALEAMLERVMKTNGLSCGDKDIARWVESEIRALVPPFEGATSPSSRPAGAS
ncbi:MAG: serine/threonine protein kinase [Deltaproteobacteria bacterium]|nr:serine/threonine protein kinase [Deltaproteobacteria bacterium]MDQ3295238.1 serine/threonine protein kinase [Myxococcota bacterium]